MRTASKTVQMKKIEMWMVYFRLIPDLYAKDKR
jgi:hypothetical protein